MGKSVRTSTDFKFRLIIRFRDYKYNKNIQALDKDWHIFSNILRE